MCIVGDHAGSAALGRGVMVLVIATLCTIPLWGGNPAALPIWQYAIVGLGCLFLIIALYSMCISYPVAAAKKTKRKAAAERLFNEIHSRGAIVRAKVKAVDVWVNKSGECSLL